MTHPPFSPRFIEGPSLGLKQLCEDHKTTVRLFWIFGLEVVVLAGFVTDGASIPGKLQFLVGGPWAMPRLLAAIVHDALYAAHWICRWVCDVVYLLVRCQNGRGTETAAKVEYAAIRVGGRSAWKEKTPASIEAARKLVKIRFILLKD